MRALKLFIPIFILIHSSCYLFNDKLIIPDKNHILNNKLFETLSAEDILVAQIKLTYIGEKQEPIETLVGYTVILSITDISLVTLYALGIPDSILSNLSRIIDKQYYSRKAFLNKLTNLIGKENTDLYGSKIMGVSMISSGKNIKMENYPIIYKKHKPYDMDVLSCPKEFPLTPSELWRILKRVNNIDSVDNEKLTYSLSLIYMKYEDKKDLFCIEGKEVFRDYYQGKELLTLLLHSIDEQNKVAYEYIYTQMNYLY